MVVAANFCAWLTDEQGFDIPSSYRRGHNVFTNIGREWLKQIVVWATTGPDVAVDTRRFRWIGVGSGVYSEIVNVEQLASPLTVTSGPDTYLRVLGTRTEPTNFSVKYVTVFSGAGADFDHHGASVDVSEAGLYVDVHDGVGTGLDPTDEDNLLVAYKTFSTLTKLAAQTLTISWELRF